MQNPPRELAVCRVRPARQPSQTDWRDPLSPPVLVMLIPFPVLRLPMWPGRMYRLPEVRAGLWFESYD